MKWLVKLFLAALLLGIVAVAAILVPKFRNMKSEYGTAAAIHELKVFVLANEGRWPASPGDLRGRFPSDGDVVIDYTMTSSRLIENRSLLREAVHPRSGKFYTYPRYEENLDQLHAALLEAKASASEGW
jgi:hypothetical protein